MFKPKAGQLGENTEGAVASATQVMGALTYAMPLLEHQNKCCGVDGPLDRERSEPNSASCDLAD